MTKKVKNDKVLKNEKVSKIKKSKKDKTVVINSNCIDNLVSIKTKSFFENELIVDNQKNIEADDLNIENQSINETADADFIDNQENVDNQENTEPVDLIIDNEIIDNEATDDVDNQENDFDLYNEIDIENEELENDNENLDNQENETISIPLSIYNKLIGKKSISKVKTTSDKKETIIFDLLSRPCGASINELIEATGWQKHSIRGTLSNLQKDLQFSLLNIELSRPNFDKIKNDKSEVDRFIKETRYFIKDADYTFNNFFNDKQENQNTLETNM